MKLAHASLVTPCGAVCEDRAGAFEVGDSLVVYVADGAGGVAGGAAASRWFAERVEVLVEGVAALAERIASPELDWVRLAFVGPDVELRRQGIGETTAVLVVVGPHGVVGASTGDSEAWIVSGERMDDLTLDQPRERLGRASVFGATPGTFRRPRLDGTLVVATDGLFKYASRETICRLAALPPDEACRALTDAVRLRSGALPDDVGVVVVRAE